MQGFNFMYNDYGAPVSRRTDILFKNSEAAKAGQAVKLDAGRFTKAGATDPIAGFLTHNLDAGTDQRCEVMMAREGDVYHVPYTGTPAGGFVPGASAVVISSDALSVNSATVTGGSISVLEVNTNKKTAIVKVKNRQLS